MRLATAMVLGVCALGALDANGVVDVPAPALVQEARADLEAVQQRSVDRLACREATLRAQDAADPTMVDACTRANSIVLDYDAVVVE